VVLHARSGGQRKSQNGGVGALQIPNWDICFRRTTGDRKLWQANFQKIIFSSQWLVFGMYVTIP